MLDSQDNSKSAPKDKSSHNHDDIRLSEAVIGKIDSTVLNELKRLRTGEMAPLLHDSELFKITSAVSAIIGPRADAYENQSAFARFFSSTPQVTQSEILQLISPRTAPEVLSERLESLCQAGILSAIWVEGSRYSNRYITGYRITELGSDCLQEVAQWHVDTEEQTGKSQPKEI